MYEIDAAGIVETRTEWTPTINNKTKQLLNNQFPYNLLSTSHGTTNYRDNTCPGGTATIITGSLVTAKLQDIRDKSGLGRWSGFSFQLPNRKELNIITAYRPNEDSKHGSNTTFQQQTRQLRSQGIEINPRSKMLADLSTIINDIHNKENLIILMWDANEPLGGRDLIHFQAKTTLIALMSNNQGQFSTYARG
jgi:hypothetical protein